MSPKSLAILVVALNLLVGCDAVDTMKEEIKHSQTVAAKLESALGVKTRVGFNWNNGSLDLVTVTFTGVPNAVGLPEITARVRQAILAEFKQDPKTIVVAFTMTQ